MKRLIVPILGVAAVLIAAVVVFFGSSLEAPMAGSQSPLPPDRYAHAAPEESRAGRSVAGSSEAARDGRDERQRALVEKAKGAGVSKAIGNQAGEAGGDFGEDVGLDARLDRAMNGAETDREAIGVLRGRRLRGAASPAEEAPEPILGWAAAQGDDGEDRHADRLEATGRKVGDLKERALRSKARLIQLDGTAIEGIEEEAPNRGDDKDRTVAKPRESERSPSGRPVSKKEAPAFEASVKLGNAVTRELIPAADFETSAIVDLQQLAVGAGSLHAQTIPADPRPDTFLPRMCYFENTYLGGNAAYLERMRRLASELPEQPHLNALLDAQPFDAPEDAGLRLTAALDRRWVDRPGRVMLQIGLQGSRRFGWRRPPLDVVLVVDQGAPEGVLRAANALLRRVGPQDRVGVLAVGAAEPVAEVAGRRAVRTALVRGIEALDARDRPVSDLASALREAGQMLQTAAGDTARVPGTQTIILITRRNDAAAVAAARRQVHGLTVLGVVTSVIELGGAQDGGWWAVANAGHGNLHRAADLDALATTLDQELESLARVIARLLRINVRLAPDVEAIRVLGSRVLGQQEVKEVKAREVATDQNLSRTLGVKADRGEDEDGIQTVIPYFYGGDSHVVLIELWVNAPGPVADVSLRYKDMVGMGNASARTSAALGRVPRPDTRTQMLVRKNTQGFGFAGALKSAAVQADRGDWGQVRQTLRRAGRSPADRRVVSAFETLLSRGELTNRRTALRDALSLAADRRIGASTRLR